MTTRSAMPGEVLQNRDRHAAPDSTLRLLEKFPLQRLRGALAKFDGGDYVLDKAEVTK